MKRGNKGLGCLVLIAIALAIYVGGRGKTPGAATIDEYAAIVQSGLAIAAGGRDVRDVRVINNEASTGERIVMISYITTERTDAGLVDEYLDVLEAAAQTIHARSLNLNVITLAIGAPNGDALGAVVANYDDVYAWTRGELTRGELLMRLSVTGF